MPLQQQLPSLQNLLNMPLNQVHESPFHDPVSSDSHNAQLITNPFAFFNTKNEP
jgi:hypothetical protein